MHGVQGEPDPLVRVPARGVVLPFGEQAMKRAEQKMAGPAGRIDHLHDVVTELVDGRAERQIEDELLDELRGLQQRIALARVLGEVLVEVTEETGVPRRVGEVVDESSVLAAAAPEGDQTLGRVMRHRDLVERVVPPVEQGRAHGHTGDGVEGGEQPVTVGLGRMGAEELVLGLLRQRHAGRVRPGQVRLGEQAVVLAEPDEHGGEHPGDRGLGDPFVPP